MRSRGLDGGKKGETLSLFFSLNFDHQEATMNCVVSFSTLRVFPLIYNVRPINLNPWIKWHLNNHKETLILLGFKFITKGNPSDVA